MIGRLVLPDRIVYEGEVTGVVVRTLDGDATFLAGHTPFIAALVPGSAVRFDGGDEAISAVLGNGGFVEVDGEVVTVSAPVAETD
ncbi:MAG: F0F1 ATP synthase subunit epsilon [Actinobacteria bacterium]|nr:F0F1 ATP synthase subunit epsilon [Actinomycetota bacterium]